MNNFKVFPIYFLENDRDNLNPKAYVALRKNIDINTVREELARQRDLFVAWVKDPRSAMSLIKYLRN